MRKDRLIYLMVYTLTALLLVACSGRASQGTNDSGYTMMLETQETAVGDSTLVIHLTDASGKPVENATVAIKGDMSHAGMEPVLAEVSGGVDGRYTLPVRWTMGGDWIITAEATLPNGQVITQRFNPITIQGDMTNTEDGSMNQAEHGNMEGMDGEEMNHGDSGN